jgi:hypothetical protein
MGLGQFARAVLEAEGADIVGRGADEHDPFGRAGIGEFDVFGQEAIAGVDRPGAGCLGRGDDRGDVEIAFAGAAPPMHTASSARATWASLVRLE